jgi:hypothetical protein
VTDNMLRHGADMGVVDPEIGAEANCSSIKNCE